MYNCFVVRLFFVHQPVGDDGTETRFLQRDLSLARSIAVLVSKIYTLISLLTFVSPFLSFPSCTSGAFQCKKALDDNLVSLVLLT